jgi:choloylglycine hydrolase
LFTLRAVTAAIVLVAALPVADACTYIRLVGADGSSHPGHTMEWGGFDFKFGFVIMPRGMKLNAMKMPDGKAGASWTGKYGMAGINMLGKDRLLADAINEKGLVINLLYLPHFADYQTYDPAQAAKSLSPTDFVAYVASQAASVAVVLRESRM